MHVTLADPGSLQPNPFLLVCPHVLPFVSRVCLFLARISGFLSFPSITVCLLVSLLSVGPFSLFLLVILLFLGRTAHRTLNPCNKSIKSRLALPSVFVMHRGVPLFRPCNNFSASELIKIATSREDRHRDEAKGLQVAL